MVRILDIVLSLFGILVLIPFWILIFIWITIDAGSPVIFTQTRVGKGNIDFRLFKFRTMSKNSEEKGFLTVGSEDSRITKSGKILRRFKLDELPQLFNVLKGDMSMVGPRPEVRKYVDLYTEEQKKILIVRPGITDMASIMYFDENNILAASENPENTYIQEILPKKIEINLKYIENKSIWDYFGVIVKTIGKIFT